MTREHLAAVSAEKGQLELRTQVQLKELQEKLKWAEMAIASLRVRPPAFVVILVDHQVADVSQNERRPSECFLGLGHLSFCVPSTGT